MTKRVNTFKATSYTNSIGQTINPGDSVFCVSTCTGSTKTKVAEFKGVWLTDAGLIAAVSVVERNKEVTKFNYEAYNNKEPRSNWRTKVNMDVTSTLPRKRIVKIENQDLNLAKSLRKYI